MAIATELLKVLVCPKCKGSLTYQSKEDALQCLRCSLLFPIHEGVAEMSLEDAFEIGKGGELMSKVTKAPSAIFKIKEGPNQGETLKLSIDSCRAIGRSIDDVNKTQIFNVEPTVPLDDFTKKLVLNYLSKKRGKSSKAAPTPENAFGNFKRLPDLVLNDPAVSRLHAMIFYDESGAGVLDLVSRNGTYVNGQEVESRALKEGDLIEIGATKIVFTMSS